MLGSVNLEKFEISDGWIIYVKSTLFKIEVSIRNSEDEVELPWTSLELRIDKILEGFSNRELEDGEFEKIKDWLEKKKK